MNDQYNELLKRAVAQQSQSISLQPPILTGSTSIGITGYDPNIPKPRFQPGDIVVVEASTEGIFESDFSIVESEDTPIQMQVTQVNHDGTYEVNSASGHRWACAGQTTLTSYDEFMAKRKKHRETANKTNFAELDKVVIGKAERDEIEAVLKQHEHSAKIFEEWGLGSTIEYGRGMTFMFYGPPGTGKTWASTCIAKAMGKQLLVISASNIQSSEPGGANRNIENAFRSAKEKKQVLFIDECDSLITQRNDVGMVLGSEINTLLTEIEKFEGILILATNRIDTLDEALERRISLIIEFPHPDFEKRKKIWKQMLPPKMPLAKNVKVEKLAEYNLTGGQIKNVLLQAARLAAAVGAKEVVMANFEAAVKRVQQSKSLMGTASRYVQLKVKEDFTKV